MIIYMLLLANVHEHKYTTRGESAACHIRRVCPRPPVAHTGGAWGETRRRTDKAMLQSNNDATCCLQAASSFVLFFSLDSCLPMLFRLPYVYASQPLQHQPPCHAMRVVVT